MSFLLEDDAHATLQVALAFIDAHEDDDEGATSNSITSSSSESLANRYILPAKSASYHEQLAFSAAIYELLGNETHKVSTQRSRDAHYEAVKRSRTKKKAEVTRLHSQVAALEENLRRLQCEESPPMQAQLQQ